MPLLSKIQNSNLVEKRRMVGEFYGIPNCCVDSFLTRLRGYKRKALPYVLCSKDCRESLALERLINDKIKSEFGIEYLYLLDNRFSI